MKWREVFHRMLPWQPRSERKAGIAAAAAERERSRAGRELAEVIDSQIKRLAEANHFSELIAHDIIHGRRHGNGGKR